MAWVGVGAPGALLCQVSAANRGSLRPPMRDGRQVTAVRSSGAAHRSPWCRRARVLLLLLLIVRERTATRLHTRGHGRQFTRQRRG
jgi:hypothetical protein